MTTHTFDMSRYHRLSEEDAASHSAISFSDRDSYLAWVAAWKAAWHATVEDIRSAKATRRDRTKPDEDRFAAQNRRLELRVVAFNLLMIRMAARERARQAWAMRMAA